ncbi:MAG: TonB C-terminal domain-containing protein [Candidatus Dependentiae bacterium]|nr:TonB C-terminal domain-containing protein [Candidatus Dependentiae bacterium]
MEDHKKETGLHPIVVWIIASILLHLLFIVISIVLRIDEHKKENILKKEMTISAKDKQNAIMMLDQPKKPQVISQAQALKQSAIQKPAQPQKAEPKSVTPPKPQAPEPPVVHTLIPGRQGVDKQNLIDDDGGAEIPKKEKSQELPKEVQQPDNFQKEQAQKQEPKQEENNKEDSSKTSPEKKEFINKEEPITISKKTTPANQYQDPEKTIKPDLAKEELLKKDGHEKTIEKNETIENEIPKSLKNLKKLTTDNYDLDPYPFSPKPHSKSRMSLKDLSIGFDNYRKNIGNSQHLIQQGNTTAAASGQSLKMITYNNQFAKTMLGSIHTHPQYQSIQYVRGKQIVLAVTIDRQGTLLKLDVIASSGDTNMDKIMVESIQSAGLYPAVPSFVPDDPFFQRWTILH